MKLTLALALIAFAHQPAAAQEKQWPACMYSRCSAEAGLPDPDDPKVQRDTQAFQRRLLEAQTDCSKDMTPYVNYEECVMMTYAMIWDVNHDPY